MDVLIHKGKGRVAVFLLFSALLILLSFEISAQSGNANPNAFGIGKPHQISDLPPGQFKKSLQTLTPKAKANALKKLQGFTFPAQDVEYLRVNIDGHIWYADTFLPAELDDSSPIIVMSIPETEIFKLHSKPGSSNVLYLDFDGHVITGTQWNNHPTYGTGIDPHPALPFDPSNNDVPNTVANFTSDELNRIGEIWHRISEDFAPWDIDVTTEEPVSFTATTGRLLFTEDSDANGANMPSAGAGGVAWINVFGNASYVASYSPALVYWENLGSGNATYNAEAGSHEFGHNIALGHDGTSTLGYYSGHGSGFVSWGPIMGTGYNDNVSQWSMDTYPDANNPEDDLAIIDGDLGYDADDHGDTAASATELVIEANGDILVSNPELDPHNVMPENKGVIGSETDVDWFFMDIGAGPLDITATPAWHAFTRTSSRGANLDIELNLYDSNEILVVSSQPVDNTDANINLASVTAGRYYLRVTGVGHANYPAYGSIGMFFIDGSVEPAVPDTTPPSPDPMTWAVTPTATGTTSITMTATTATDASGFVEYYFDCVTGGGGCVDSGWQSSTVYNATGLDTSTQYTYRVQAQDNTPNATGWSSEESATTQEVAPQAPGGLSANAISVSQINLAWTDNSNNETGFRIFHSMDDISYFQIDTTAANATSWPHTGLTANTTHYYKVSATNAVGDSSLTGPVNATTWDNPPSPPGSLVANAVSASQINLGWSDNSSNESGFEIERSPNGTGSWVQVDTVGMDVTTYPDTGLSSDTTYWYRVNATNSGGDSGYSNTASAATDQLPPVASFTVNCTRVLCSLTDTSTDSDGTVDSWSWDFGDGTGTTVQHAVKGYASNGGYTITLTVTDDDGATGQDSQIVNVVWEGGTQILDIAVAMSSDDADQQVAGGAMDLGAALLDLRTSPAAQERVLGLRFNNVNVPQGKTLTEAYISFTAAEPDSGGSSVTIRGEDIDNAPTFNGTSANITSRTKTSASTTWAIPNFTGGNSYNTPSLLAVAQEVIDRPGWAAGQSMAFTMQNGSGRRKFSSFDGSPANAATLHLEFDDAAPVCTTNRVIQADIWESFSLSCYPQANNTVQDIFSSLVTAGRVYDTDWFVWRYDAATNTYHKMAPVDEMYPGQGYWIYTLYTTTIDFTGVSNMTGDLGLETNATNGILNYLGNTENSLQQWTDFQAVHGAALEYIPNADPVHGAGPDTECEQVPPTSLCLVSRTAYVWKAGSWDILDAHTPIGNDIDPGYGVFVRGFSPGTMLRLTDPPAPAPPVAQPADTPTQNAPGNSGNNRENNGKKKDKKNKAGWFIRVIAESGFMKDRSNVFGQLETSMDGQDSNDIEELPPFGDRYLSLTFENPGFEDTEWGFSSDFRAPDDLSGGEWQILVRASSDVEEVALSWQGDFSGFDSATLRDEQSGQIMEIDEQAQYIFTNEGENRFTLVVQ